jgi:hypothetical protein
MIAVLGDQDMGEQGGGREALGDRPLRGRRLVDGAAGPAAIARPADADDAEPRRNMVEHLADGLADQVQRAATAGAGLMLDIEPDVLPGQVRRQARPLVLGLGCISLSLGKRKAGFDAGKIGVEVLKAKL